jgi:integrase
VDWLEIIPRNPFKKVRLRDDRSGPTVIAVLSPAMMEKCLAYAAKQPEPARSRLTAYLCLGGFAGLRTEEILEAHWEDLHFAEGEVFVRQPKRVRGWKPRYVEMLPVFHRFMAGLAPTGPAVSKRAERRGKDGKLGLNTAKVLPGGQRTLYLLRKAMMKAVGMKRWPLNCLRHSYGTYFLAEFQDLAKLRGQMGHESEDVTRARYVAPAKRADCKAWWGMKINAI